jgi:hypothetical protein
MARKKKQVFERLEKMIPTREMAALQDLVIYQDTDGSYQLFNKYAIRKTPVAYEVTILTSDKKLSFNSLKNATAWCIFDKRDKFYETRRIEELDGKIGSLDVDIQIQQKLYRNAKTEDDLLINVAKLSESRLRKKIMIEELEGYTTDSKHWQERRFEVKPQ